MSPIVALIRFCPNIKTAVKTNILERRDNSKYFFKDAKNDLEEDSCGPSVAIVTRDIDFLINLNGKMRNESFLTYKGANIMANRYIMDFERSGDNISKKWKPKE